MKTKSIGLILILVISCGVQALGFRDISVDSFLNEPLNSRIELVSINPADVNGLRVSLASPEAFQKAGLARPLHLTKLQFNVLVGNNQQAHIHVTTKESVREPYLNFLLEVAWDENRLLREFTILLDPPASNFRPAKTTSIPAASELEQKIAASPQASPGKSISNQQYGPVKRTETLWMIATRVRPDSSVSVEQMMMALLRANPHAFQHGNVNFLKQGAVLDVPGFEEIKQLSVSDARLAFAQQTSEWKALRGVPSASGRVAAAGQAVPDGVNKDETQAEQKLTQDVAGDGVKLSVVETGGEEPEKTGAEDKPAKEERVVSDEGRLRDEIADSKKDLEAVLEINRDMENLQGALELKIEALRKSLEERNQAIDDLERRLNNFKAESGATEAKASGTPPIVGEQQKVAGGVDSNIEMGRKQVEKKTPAEPMRDDWLAMAEEYWLQLIAAAFLLLVLILLFFLMRRRAESNLPDSESFGSYIDLDDQPATKEHILAPQHANRQQRGAEGALLEGDFSPDTNADVESALAEVDVYLAYRRYGPAEELIKRTIENNPEKMILKAKLLEIYAFRKDKKRFVSAMEEVYQSMIARSPEIWAKVVEIGRNIVPDHELIAGTVLSDDDAVDIVDNFAFGPNDLTESNSGKRSDSRTDKGHT